MQWLINLFKAIFKPASPKEETPAAPPKPQSTPTITPPLVAPSGPSLSGGVPKNLESTCPSPGIFGAVDLCQPVTPRFLEVMRYLGVKTIIRYYDRVNESLKGKTPHAEEIAMIKAAGFKMLCVFQHSNNSIVTFQTPGRGQDDSARACELAGQWNQPKGSCIYAGVDFDPTVHELEAVKQYFRDFGTVAKAHGYRVGAYGSGLTLETLLDAKLIDLAWLSMSTGFQRSQEFAQSKRWALHQVKDRNCGGINVDFDYTNGDIGDWNIP